MKNLFFVVVFLIVSTTIFSQVKVLPGIKTGINFSNLTNSVHSSTKAGEYVGLFVNVYLAKFYELQL